MRRRLLLAFAAVAALSPAAAAASGGEDKKKAGGESYIPIETLTAYTTRGARRGVMTVDCGLDVPDEALRERVELVLPRIRAAFVQVVQIYAGGLPSGAPPDPDFIVRNLQRAADEELGRKGARVLIGAVLVN